MKKYIIVKNVAKEAMQNASAAYIINKYMNGLLDPKIHVYVPANDAFKEEAVA
jgi:hypothetical protein